MSSRQWEKIKADPELHKLKLQKQREDYQKKMADPQTRAAYLQYFRERDARIRSDPQLRRRKNIGNTNWRHNCDFEKLWEEQGGLCAICNRPMVEFGRGGDRACVDHDHRCCAGDRSCGRCIRGLIHATCNQLLGLAHDDIEVLLGAACYLERTPNG